MADSKRDKGVWLIAALFVAPVLGADVCVGSIYVRAARSELFEPTAGVVTRSEIAPGQQGAVVFDLEYTYTVGGRQHNGTKYHPQTHFSGGPWYWHAARDANPVGTQVTVHYDPNEPGTAYLATGLRPDVPFVLLLLTPFNLSIVIFWPVLIGPRLRAFAPALRRCVRRIPNGWRVRAAPNTLFLWTALVIFWLITIFGAFPSLVFFAVFTEFDRLPPWWVGIAVWVLFLTAAILLATRKSRRGLLHVNEHEGTVAFVHNKAWKVVTREKLLGLDIMTVWGRREKFGPDAYHAVLLRWRNTFDGQCSLQLAEYADRADADALANWLSERLDLSVEERDDV